MKRKQESGMSKVERKKFEKDRNPFRIMQEYMLSYSWRRPVPDWVEDELYRWFREYEVNRGKKSLDAIAATNPGKGGKNPYEDYEREHRDWFMMHNLHQIKAYYKMTGPDAATVLVAFLHANRQYHKWYVPTADTIAKMYSTSGEKEAWQRLWGDQPHWICHEGQDGSRIPQPEEFREHIPEQLRLKYGIDLQSPYPRWTGSCLMSKSFALHPPQSYPRIRRPPPQKKHK